MNGNPLEDRIPEASAVLGLANSLKYLKPLTQDQMIRSLIQLKMQLCEVL